MMPILTSCEHTLDCRASQSALKDTSSVCSLYVSDRVVGKADLPAQSALVAAENCGLQIIALKEEQSLEVTYNDLYAAAKDAVAVMAATKGRFGIGGHLRCDDADDLTHAWRLVLRNPDGKTIVKQYSSFPKPWEKVKAS